MIWTWMAMAWAEPLDEREAAALDQLHADVQRIRQVTFDKPKARTMTVAELHRHEVESLAKWMTPADWWRASLALQAMDLAKPGFDLENALLSLLGQHVQGFYDPDEHELVIVDRAYGLPWRQVAGHELCHAQQLTRFEAWPTRAPGLDNDDVVAAFDGLLEGEAMLVEVALMGAQPHTADLRAILPGFWPQSPLLRQPGVPSAVLESVSYAYTFGAEFAQALLQSEGWVAFDRAFAKPPLSTEQVLHPEKYLGPDRDRPRRVPLDVRRALPGYALVEENSLGELGIATMFRQWGERDTAFGIADGWDGDRLQVWIPGDTQHVALVWRSVWDDEREADRFATALRHRWSDDRTLVERRGAEVVVLRGVPEARRAEVLDLAWRRRARTVRRLGRLIDRRALREWRRTQRTSSDEET